MRSITRVKTTGSERKAMLVSACLVLFAGAGSIFAQAPTEPQTQHATVDTADPNKRLVAQIAELRAQLARLQAPTQQTPSENQSNVAPGMNTAAGKATTMAMMDDQKEMGAMPPKAPMAPKGPMSPKAPMPSGASGTKDQQGEMGGMSGGAQSSPPAAPAAAMGMCCMGEMGGMPAGGAAGMPGATAQPPGGMAGMSGPSSAMPGQPGASHLYHIGSAGFFLNHPQHITLTEDQKMTLNRLKEKAMLDRSSALRRIDQAEQELYVLTGVDQPDASTLENKVAEIEKLRADQRLTFIRAVGEATNVLTHEQHMALMGTMAAGKK